MRRLHVEQKPLSVAFIQPFLATGIPTDNLWQLNRLKILDFSMLQRNTMPVLAHGTRSSGKTCNFKITLQPETYVATFT